VLADSLWYQKPTNAKPENVTGNTHKTLADLEKPKLKNGLLTTIILDFSRKLNVYFLLNFAA
jgi:hypothetical protein